VEQQRGDDDERNRSDEDGKLIRHCGGWLKIVRSSTDGTSYAADADTTLTQRPPKSPKSTPNTSLKTQTAVAAPWLGARMRSELHL
jgi:hypothetical protein